MTLDKLKTNLCKHGMLEICKEGLVFTVLLTGTNLSKSEVVMKIQKDVLEYAGAKYPVIEAMRNDNTFFCLILKPKQ